MNKDKKETTNTIKDRIKKLMDVYKIEDNAFVGDVMNIIERATYPNNFCPKCDEKMFFDIKDGYFKCINCNYSNAPVPQEINRKQPPVFESKDPKKSVNLERKKQMSKKINDLLKNNTVDKMDEDIIRSQDSNIKGEINWC